MAAAVVAVRVVKKSRVRSRGRKRVKHNHLEEVKNKSNRNTGRNYLQREGGSYDIYNKNKEMLCRI